MVGAAQSAQGFTRYDGLYTGLGKGLGG